MHSDYYNTPLPLAIIQRNLNIIEIILLHSESILEIGIVKKNYTLFGVRKRLFGNS